MSNTQTVKKFNNLTSVNLGIQILVDALDRSRQDFEAEIQQYINMGFMTKVYSFNEAGEYNALYRINVTDEIKTNLGFELEIEFIELSHLFIFHYWTGYTIMTQYQKEKVAV